MWMLANLIKAAYWIAGDANLPINWSISIISAKTGLEQVVDLPTCHDNTLDIVLTNRPSLMNRCEGAPGLSDHDIVLLDVNIQANRTKPVQRKIHLWKRADLDALRCDAAEWAEDYVNKFASSTDVDLLECKMQTALTHILDTHVPSKMSTVRLNKSWFNTQTKRVIRRKARAHKKARHTNKQRDWERFRRLRREAQKVCRQAYNQHIADLVSSDPSSNKRLGALVKSLRCDHYASLTLKFGPLMHLWTMRLESKQSYFERCIRYSQRMCYFG